MRKGLITAAAIWIVLAAMLMPVKAAEADTTVMGNVLKTDTEMDVHREASDTSEVTAVLDAGTVVLVTDDTGGWCRISAGDITGYIKTGYLVPLNSSEEMNLEFEQIGNNYHMIFNEVQQLEKQRLQTKIWGTVIAVLVVGIFAAGIIPVLRKNGKDEENSAGSETIQ